MQLFEQHISYLPWLEALLIGLLLIISAIQPRTIALSLQALTSPIQRRYVRGENNPVLWVLRKMFQLGVVSLSLLVAMKAYAGSNDVEMVEYGKLMGVMVVVMTVKALVDRWIQLTFRYEINAKTYYTYRSELWMIMSVMLLVALMISPWLSDGIKWGIPCVVVGLYMIVLWWKLMQVFGWNIKHIGYTLVYMAHVEVLPVVAVLVIGYRL